jgi:hypothetical protein
MRLRFALGRNQLSALLPFLLPQPNCRAGWIGNYGKRTFAGHFGDVLADHRAQRFRLGGRGRDIVNQHIGQPGGGDAGSGRPTRIIV